MAQVEFENVSKVYLNGTRAVDGLSLQIDDGEMVVLVGPSGCGKSTALRLVAGLEQTSGGSIRIGGRVVNDVPPKSRDLAMVFQNYALYPHMTVRENLAFGLKLRKTPRAQRQQRIDEAAQMLGIKTLLDRRPAALSGGQQQRVALGRAIVRKPACFLFDEPLSNLDAKLRTEMRAEIKRLHRRLGATSIYVTHDQEEAMTLGDRLVVMREGRVQQSGLPLQVYNDPANRFVAGFMGLPPMNFLDGTIFMLEGRPWFEDRGVRVPLGTDFSAFAEQSVTLGFRPASLSLGAATPDGTSIGVTVGVVEPLGERQDVYLTTDEQQRFVARVDVDARLAIGDRTYASLSPDLVHVFEQGGGERNLKFVSNTVSTSN